MCLCVDIVCVSVCLCVDIVCVSVCLCVDMVCVCVWTLSLSLWCPQTHLTSQRFHSDASLIWFYSDGEKVCRTEKIS